jgi:hypothetical protein
MLGATLSDRDLAKISDRIGMKKEALAGLSKGGMEKII